MKIFVFYLLIINISTFVLYGWDKFKALREWSRISENDLLLAAALGGSVGAITAMYYFRHKTRHLKFKLGLPLILIAQLAGVYFLIISANPVSG